MKEINGKITAAILLYVDNSISVKVKKNVNEEIVKTIRRELRAETAETISDVVNMANRVIRSQLYQELIKKNKNIIK